MSEEESQHTGPVAEEQAQKSDQPPVRVAIDLSDTGAESFAMHIAFLPDGVFDPNSLSHQAAHAIQHHLRHLEDLGREDARKKEHAMITKAVLKVCEPVDGPLEAMRGPSEANH